MPPSLGMLPTPLTVTGISPAKMLFGREIRTKIPSVKISKNKDLEVANRDRDQIRHAKESRIVPGDVVLVKNGQPKTKLSTLFEEELYRVMGKQGSEVTVESSDGVTYRRNSSHVKKYHQEEEGTGESEGVIENNDRKEEVRQGTDDNRLDRSRSEHKVPQRFDEYVLYK